MTEDLKPFLQAGPTVQSDDDAVVGFARRAMGTETRAVDQAVLLYYAVRDEVRYDGYDLDISVEGLCARRNLELGRGWCISKAVLLAACCRAVGIPARLGYADVRNHLSTRKMRERMGTNLFFWHGYTSIFLDGGWVKATPAFNLELCHKFRLQPLDFNGKEDSLYHPFDLEGHRHMEYVHERGEFAEPPIDRIRETFRREYPNWKIDGQNICEDFESDVAIETAN
ncbi:MAG: transglutaminase family protein [Candidatus Thioglobus sp.]|nr:MAG: transglutaminase family protein [Candidatus Thioglobus sp.]